MKFFVTGGSRGIGEAVVMRSLEAGHDVAFTYVSQEAKAFEVLGKAKAQFPERKCRAYRMDVSRSSEVEEIGERAIDDFDGMDVVVSNAGININNLVVSMSDDEWQKVMNTNLNGAFYVCRQFLQTFLGNGYGRYIFISSLGHSGVSGQVAYSASKAGLHGLSRAVAKEYGKKGITSNCVVPGFFDTDMTREGMSESNRSFWLKYCPAGRLGELNELAACVLWLASKEAGFVNGQEIALNGGLDWAP